MAVSLPPTFIRRGWYWVDPCTGSTISPSLVECFDPLGCGNITHKRIKFSMTIYKNTLDERFCKIKLLTAQLSVTLVQPFDYLLPPGQERYSLPQEISNLMTGFYSTPDNPSGEYVGSNDPFQQECN